ncbi:lysophospholipid acyltransferase family protein [Kribbella shirazensis]|uniref:1-acyl-sn-glycerol-3-phosphate acyltransferase n=1 Tax=Kribbella shirazensis TaxID=1105143 RepID=A0A7X5VD76_9ACTN|nr:lysophospholipid acyltransferase family protein [Kribbella shirazensis]NIK59064.1 1-acyl-sn-glycerol-3-phosphate acyltransferase [Kribbella shirazensis]
MNTISSRLHLERAVPHPPTWLLYRGRRWLRAFVEQRYGVRLHGTANVPAEGPVIFAANHLGVLDGPILAAFAPRPAHIVTKAEMFVGPLGTLLRAAGQIPLDRFHYDPAAVKACVRALSEGHAVGIFPEGIRGDGELRTVRPGAAYLAMVTGAPVVPVAFFGTRDPGSARSAVPASGAVIDVVFGEPLAVNRVRWPRTRLQVEHNRAVLHAHLLRQLDEAKHLTGRSLPGPPRRPRHRRASGGVRADAGQLGGAVPQSRA